VQRASPRRSVFGVLIEKSRCRRRTAHTAHAGRRWRWRQDLQQSSAAQPVLDLGDTSRRRVALSPISLKSFVFAAASRSSRHLLLLCACVRAARRSVPLQEFCLSWRAHLGMLGPQLAQGVGNASRGLCHQRSSPPRPWRWTAAFFLKSEREKVRIGKPSVRTVGVVGRGGRARARVEVGAVVAGAAAAEEVLADRVNLEASGLRVMVNPPAPRR